MDLRRLLPVRYWFIGRYIPETKGVSLEKWAGGAGQTPPPPLPDGKPLPLENGKS
ncbi:hypothetical protein M8494_30855 [Serratia ureilytica]